VQSQEVTMKHATTLVLTAMCFGMGPLLGQSVSGDDPVEARLWVDGGDEPVVQRGERVQIRYRTSADAYSAVFRIDTDGRITLLHPSTPWHDGWAAGGRDHRMVLEQSPFWTVADDPGIGYFFLVSSPEPLDLAAFEYDGIYGWDLSPVGAVVYDDPYVAMDDFVAALIPSWKTVPYGLDFVTYHVGEARSYPRFLCYDCHTARDFSDWNPYAEVCSEYRIVVYDDPYYHPAFRYSGTRTVYPQPLPNRPRYAVAVRGNGDTWTPIVRTRAAPSRPVAFKETPVAGSRSASPVRRPAAVRPGSGAREAPGAPRTGASEPLRRGAKAREVPAATSTPVRAPSAPRESAAQPAPDGSSRPVTRSGTPRPDARAPAATPARRPAAVAPGRATPSRPPAARPPAARPPAATARPRPVGRPAPRSRPAAGSPPARPPSRPARAARPPARSQAPAPPARPRGGPGRGGA
jgi:hypothetical protein